MQRIASTVMLCLCLAATFTLFYCTWIQHNSKQMVGALALVFNFAMIAIMLDPSQTKRKQAEAFALFMLGNLILTIAIFVILVF